MRKFSGFNFSFVQYTMLSGRAPFHARSRDDSAAAIMSRIKGGEFHFNDEAWAPVSQQAKALTKGEHCWRFIRGFLFFLMLACPNEGHFFFKFAFCINFFIQF